MWRPWSMHVQFQHNSLYIIYMYVWWAGISTPWLLISIIFVMQICWMLDKLKRRRRALTRTISRPSTNLAIAIDYLFLSELWFNDTSNLNLFQKIMTDNNNNHLWRTRLCESYSFQCRSSIIKRYSSSATGTLLRFASIRLIIQLTQNCVHVSWAIWNILHFVLKVTPVRSVQRHTRAFFFNTASAKRSIKRKVGTLQRSDPENCLIRHCLYTFIYGYWCHWTANCKC